MDRYLLISSDCHGGPRPQDARAYLDPSLRSDFDAWLADGEARSRRQLDQMGMPLFGEEVREEFESEDEVESGGLKGAWDSARRLRPQWVGLRREEPERCRLGLLRVDGCGPQRDSYRWCVP